MSASERLEDEGRLGALKLEARAVGLSISGLIHTLRAETNPFKDISEMNAELIHEQAFELSQKIDQFNGFALKIKGLKERLGIK